MSRFADRIQVSMQDQWLIFDLNTKVPTGIRAQNRIDAFKISAENFKQSGFIYRLPELKVAETRLRNLLVSISSSGSKIFSKHSRIDFLQLEVFLDLSN